MPLKYDDLMQRKVKVYTKRLEAINQLYIEDNAAALRQFDDEQGQIDDAREWLVTQWDATDKQAVIAELRNNMQKKGRTLFYLRHPPDRRIEWIEGTLDAVRFIDGDSLDELQHLNHLGLAYSELGDVEQAIHYFQVALTIAKRLANAEEQARILGNMGLAYARSHKFQEALDSYEQAYQQAHVVNDRSMQADFLTSIGDIYLNLRQYRLAEIALDKASIILEPQAPKSYHLYIDGTLGNLAMQQRKYRKAKEHFERCLEHYDELNDSVGKINALINLGEACRQIRLLDESKEHLELAIELAEENNKLLEKAYAYFNIAVVYLNKGCNEEARKFATSARDLFKDMDIKDKVREAERIISQTRRWW